MTFDSFDKGCGKPNHALIVVVVAVVVTAIAFLSLMSLPPENKYIISSEINDRKVLRKYCMHGIIA